MRNVRTLSSIADVRTALLLPSTTKATAWDWSDSDGEALYPSDLGVKGTAILN